MAIKYLDARRIRGISGIPASTNWTIPSGFTLTSGTGMIVDTTSTAHALYDLGVAGAIDTNDDMVIDFDITRNSGDYHDHPSLIMRSVDAAYGDPTSNGENQLLLCYHGNGDTSDSGGGISAHLSYRASNTAFERGANASYTQSVGDTIYYRYYVSKAGDTALDLRLTAWTSDANRTAEGATGREFDVTNTFGGATPDWADSDPLRYLMVRNQNGNQANWTLKSFKFWNGVASTGVADNMLSHTPTLALDFTDVPEDKATLLPTTFEQLSGGGGLTISNGNAREEIAQQFNAGHVLIDETVSKCSFYLSSGEGSPTGNMSAYIRQADGTLKQTSPDTVDASTVSSETEYTFTFTPTVIDEDDMITCCLDNGTGTASNTVSCVMGSGTMTNGTLYKGSACGSGYTEVSGEQFKMTVTPDAKIPANTIFEETDTRYVYWLQDNEWEYSFGRAPLRAVVAGGGQADAVSGDTICYFSISTLGNATAWGADLTQARAGIASGQCNNDTRAVFACGDNAVTQNVMDYVTVASAGTCTDFGDYSAGCNVMGIVSQKNSDGRAVGGGGYIYPSGSDTNVMSYFNIGTTGNTSDFGDLTTARYSIGGLSNATRGLFGGGQESSARTANIDYITIATTGNATNFGTLFQTQTAVGGLANATRGIFCGGYGRSDVMEYVTIASTGNATDFGNLSEGAVHISGVADSTRGCICGGSEASVDMNNEIQYVTIDTLGNTTDFGDLIIGNKGAGTGAA